MNYSEGMTIIVVVPVVAINVEPTIIEVPVGVKIRNELCSQLTKSKSPSFHFSI